MTTQQDNVIMKYTPSNDYPILVDGTYEINGGDLVYFDSSAHVIKSLDSDAHAAYLAGMAENGSYLNVYGKKKYFDRLPVVEKGVVRLNTTTAETYYEGTAVYFGADAQTITTVAGSYIVGYCKLGAGQTSVSGTTQSWIGVQLAPKWPTADVA
jgi:hypothetical protein